MEIYIDNEKIEIGKKNKKNLEKILKAIIKRLERNEKIIRTIYINGSKIEGNAIIDVESPNIIEVETKSFIDLIIESLANSRYYLETFFEIVSDISYERGNNQAILKEDINDIHTFLYWFTDLIYLLEESYNFEDKKLSELLRSELKTLSEKKKKKNYDAYFNLLENNLLSMLDNFYTNIDYLYETILEDEKKKKLLS